MKDLIAKYRSLIACALAVLLVAGCKSPISSEDAVKAALAESKLAGPNPFSFKSTKFGATGDNPAGWIIDPTTGNLVAPSGKVIAGLSQKQVVDAVATANLASLTGLAVTVDGVALGTAGMRVLTTLQTTTTQDGCYVVASSAWTRCTDFASGSSAAGTYFVAKTGTANKGIWVLTNAAGSDVVGTADLTAVNLISGGGGAVSSVFARTGAVVATQGDYTATQVGAFAGADVYVASTGALPTYTYANGTLGVGATITATANGAFPVIDGLTLVANDPIKGLIYVRHGASAIDNGVYMLTTQGSGGAAWVLTRYTLLDQAAELPLSKLRIGATGQEFLYTALATPVMGTTHLFWKDISPRISTHYGVRYRSDFGFQQSIAAATSALIPGTDLYGITQSTASGLNTNVTNTGTQHGVFQCLVGSTVTGVCGFAGAFTAAITDPGGGDSVIVSQDMGWDITWDVAQPTLSDGTNTFAINVGWSKTRNNAQKLPSDFIGFISDSTSGVSATHWITAFASAGVSTGTLVDSGVTINLNQFYALRSRKDPGDNLIHLYIDGVEIGTGTNTNVSASLLTIMAMAFKSVGGSTTTAANFGGVRVDVDFPAGLAA